MGMESPWDVVTLKLWYGGSIRKGEYHLVYGSRCFRTVGVDPDEVCWFTLVEEAEKCEGFRKNVDGIFFVHPVLGLQRVENDKDVGVMTEHAVGKRVVECYLVPEKFIPEALEVISEGSLMGEELLRSIIQLPQKLTPRRKEESKGISVNVDVGKGPSKSTSDINAPVTLNSSKQSVSSKPSKPTKQSASSKQTASSKQSKQTPPIPTETLLGSSNPIPTETLTGSSHPIPTESIFDCNDDRIADLFDSYEAEADNAGLKVFDQGECDDLSESEDPGYDPDEDEDGDSESDVSVTDEELFEVNVLNEEVENLIEKEIESDGDSDEELQLARKKVKCWNANALKIAKQLQIEAASTLLPGQEKEAESDKSKVAGNESKGDEGRLSDYDSSGDEIHTPVESDEDPIPGNRRKKRIPEVDDKSDFSKLRWCVGIRFPNREYFRDCVTRYAIAQGRNVTFHKSDKARGQRLGVRCVSGCPFKLYASWDNTSACILVKSVDPNHTCHRNMEKNRQLKSSWLAKQFLEVFKARPHWPAADIIETVRRAYKVIIKKNFAYRVKYIAHRMLHGSMKDHYSKIGSYIQALTDEEPNSVFTLATVPGKIPVFQRLFVCFDGLKQGWLQGCRRVLCVDSCFLKTFLGGQLIAATGRDANEQMFPLAWAVVEGENNGSYEWFFKELKKVLAEEDGNGWTIISDQHQSILTMVAQELPRAEHRQCARHIFANWHKSYKGDEMKMLFWNCAKSYNQADFEEAIAAMREVDDRAAEAFLACNPSVFCRAFISTTTKTDVIVNNMAETFNAYIIEARAKHVIYMLDDIRTAMMQRLANKKAEMEKQEITVCPRVQARLEIEKDKAAAYEVLPSSTTRFQVKQGIDEVKVDLVERTCSCRKWDLTGIPCSHAVAAIFSIHGQAEEYVDDMYKKDVYLKAYGGSIAPYPGQRYWPKVALPLNPPPIKIGPGRPRKKRRRDPHEDPKNSGRLTKHGLQMTCSVCKSKTHNKRRCPDKDKVIEPATKKSKGRPRMNNGGTECVASTSTAHHTATANPTRTGRGGRTVRTGRGRGAPRGRRGRGRVPVGVGVLFDDNGNPYSSNGGAVTMIADQGATQATQESVAHP